MTTQRTRIAAPAILTNKRAEKVINAWALYQVDVTCPCCGYTRSVWFAGWSGLLCGGCGVELKRTPYRKDTDVSEAIALWKTEAIKKAQALTRQYIEEYKAKRNLLTLEQQLGMDALVMVIAGDTLEIDADCDGDRYYDASYCHPITRAQLFDYVAKEPRIQDLTDEQVLFHLECIDHRSDGKYEVDLHEAVDMGFEY